MNERGNGGNSRKPPAVDAHRVEWHPLGNAPRTPKPPLATWQKPPEAARKSPPPVPPEARWKQAPASSVASGAPKVVWQRPDEAFPKTEVIPTRRAEWVQPPQQAVQSAPRARWEAAQRMPNREQIQIIAQLEQGIADAHKGLKEIKEAFDYKASDPELRGRDLDIETWAKHHGPKEEDWSEKIGRWADTQDSRLRADARSYHALENRLRKLEIDLLAYKQAHNLV